jgi:hypothetical protein
VIKATPALYKNTSHMPIYSLATPPAILPIILAKV